MREKSRILFIVGPTGVGKTALSLELAKRIDSEIVSADSRQVYKYMDIGTAKPTPEELAAVSHHFIDIKNPDEYYSAGQFGTEARSCIKDIQHRGRQSIVVGGSGLYIRALVDGLFDPKIADEEVKLELKKEACEKGIAALYDRLKTVDPKSADRLNSTDSQRIIRALEVFEITGEPFSQFLKIETQAADFEPCFVGLTLERRELYERIENRVDSMFKNDFLDEVRELEKMGYGPELNALQSVGYKEAFLYLDNRLDFPQMVALIKQKSRNYAKRQFTWFKKDERIHWVDLNAHKDFTELADEVQRIYDKQ